MFHSSANLSHYTYLKYFLLSQGDNVHAYDEICWSFPLSNLSKETFRFEGLASLSATVGNTFVSFYIK